MMVQISPYALALTLGLASCSARTVSENALPPPCEEFRSELERSRSSPDFFIEPDGGLRELRLIEAYDLTLRFDRCFRLLALDPDAYAQARDAFEAYRQQFRVGDRAARQDAIKGMLDLLPATPR